MTDIKQAGLERLLVQSGVKERDLEFLGRISELEKDQRILKVEPDKIIGFSRYNVHFRVPIDQNEILGIVTALGFGNPSNVGQYSNPNRLQLTFAGKGYEYILRFYQPEKSSFGNFD